MRTRKWIAVSFLFATAVLLATSALASPVTVQFVNLSGNNQNGYYTYPYYLTVNHGPQIPMVCDDFYDHNNVGDSWLANITQLSSGDVSQTKFGNLHEYQEAAYLLLQTKSVNSSEWGSINWAIWKIFDPGIDPGAAYDQDVESWLNKAENADLSKVNFSGVEILTPLNGEHQEFLYDTPEPGTLLLLGSGVLGLWMRRRQQA